MRTNHAVLWLGGALLAGVSGCGSLIGLDDYRVTDSGSSVGGATGGSAAEGNATGGKATGGSGGDTASGGNSSGGAPPTCENDCDDGNDCTRDACRSGRCVHTALDVGEECEGGFCNDRAQCVSCVDDRPDFTKDSGCSAVTPRCVEDAQGTATCTGCMVSADCSDDNDCTEEACEDHWCVVTPVVAGSVCADGRACSDAGTCERCWDTRPDSEQDAGCPSGAPVCATVDDTLVCTGCTTQSDCEDDNPCTSELCNEARECVYSTVDAGTACSGGVCNGEPGAERCVTCVDSNEGGELSDADAGCTDAEPFCVEGSGGTTCQRCVDDDPGTTFSDVDSGCTGAAPFCVGGSACVACLNDTHCDDGIACTTDSCNAGVCGHAEVHSACPYNATTNSCGRCSARAAAGTGCVAGSPATESTNLLSNGSFEDGLAPWLQYSSHNYSVRTQVDSYAGSWSCWLGGDEDEESRVWQTVTLSPNAVWARVSGFVQRETARGEDGKDVAWCRVYEDAERRRLVAEPFGWTSGDAVWEPFGAAHSSGFSVAGRAGQQITLELGAITSVQPSGYTNFYFDAVSLTQYTCP